MNAHAAVADIEVDPRAAFLLLAATHYDQFSRGEETLAQRIFRKDDIFRSHRKSSHRPNRSGTGAVTSIGSLGGRGTTIRQAWRSIPLSGKVMPPSSASSGNE